MNRISQTINESCFLCKNIGQISIWMILVVSKCSIYHVQSPISLNFGGPQTSHFSTIFEKFLGIILFYVNKSACHILVTICKPSRMTNGQGRPKKTGLQYLDILCISNRQCRQFKNCPGLVSFFANPD